MKKVFGVVFLAISFLWTFLSLLTFTAGNVGELIISLSIVGIGVLGVVLSTKMLKLTKTAQPSAKSAEPNNTPPRSQVSQQQTPPHAQTSPRSQSKNKPLTLKEIRTITAEKVNAIVPSKGKATTQQLTESLYSSNDPRLPFEFQQSTQKGVDMVAHWKMADADYLGLLGLSKHDVQARFDILMKFDELYSVVRCKDRLYRKESSFGIGSMGMEMSSFSGKATSKQREIVIGRKKDGSIGKVVDIALDTTILQNAIKIIADKNGWKLKRVVGKL